jgi:hypothetical protein
MEILPTGFLDDSKLFANDLISLLGNLFQHHNMKRKPVEWTYPILLLASAYPD